jgi:hypothetical protein
LGLVSAYGTLMATQYAVPVLAASAGAFLLGISLVNWRVPRLFLLAGATCLTPVIGSMHTHAGPRGMSHHQRGRALAARGSDRKSVPRDDRYIGSRERFVTHRVATGLHAYADGFRSAGARGLA